MVTKIIGTGLRDTSPCSSLLKLQVFKTSHSCELQPSLRRGPFIEYALGNSPTISFTIAKVSLLLRYYANCYEAWLFVQLQRDMGVALLALSCTVLGNFSSLLTQPSVPLHRISPLSTTSLNRVLLDYHYTCRSPQEMVKVQL